MKVAIFTATIAFVAAMVAQWVSHRLSIKREKIKYSKEVVQEFILPILNDILLFIDTETAFRKDHDVELEIKPEEVIKTINNKISYINKELVIALLDYRDSEAYFDGRGEGKNLSIFKIFYLFLKYTSQALKNSEFDDPYLVERIDKRIKLYGAAYTLTELIGWKSTRDILSYKWVWNSTIYSQFSIDVFDKIIRQKELKIEDISHENLIVITVMENAFKEYDDDINWIYESLKEARDYVERFRC